MKTKIFFVGIFAVMMALNVNAQTETNPKLVVDKYITHSGPLLVVDIVDIIQRSDFTTDDLSSMKKSIEELTKNAKEQEEVNEEQEEVNEEQEEKMKDQNTEIVALQKEIKEIKSDYQDLLRDFKSLEKLVDDIKRKLP